MALPRLQSLFFTRIFWSRWSFGSWLAHRSS
ncbi:hypothetical protein ACVIGB_008691 [Bradyrhizobium sp. USDA 4341]